MTKVDPSQLWAIIFSKSHYKNGGFPLLIEQVSETIKKNCEHNFIIGKGNDWHIIGLFDTQDEASDFSKKLIEQYHVLQNFKELED